MSRFLRYSILILCIFALEFTSLFFPIQNLGRFFNSFRDSVQKNDKDNQTPCTACMGDTARLHAFENENATLRDQLAYTERSKQVPLIVQRIGRSTDVLQSEIVVDRGEYDGVRVGDAVIAGNGILVGTVEHVDQKKSFVLPLKDPRSKILVSILQEKNEIKGIAEGQFSIGLTMTLIPIADELKKDDLVVTSGLQDDIPAGLVIGTIQDIQKHQEDLFQSAVIRSAASLDDLAILSILVHENGK